MGKKALLIGHGMQGKAVLYDLVNHSDVSQIDVIDNQPGALDDLSQYPKGRVRGRVLDARDGKSLSSILRGVDVVIETLPGAFALPVGRLAAEKGVHLVSSMYFLNPGERDIQKIQSMKKQILEIDQKAKEKGAVILTEFGLDPGLDLILGAKAIGELDEVREFRTYGAGFPAPEARTNPLNYKFSWSVIGVMKSYSRPARIISKGEVITIAPQGIFEAENCHLLDVEEIGVPLEAFPNGDSAHYAELFGIRETVKEMGRYTCRLPGHCAFWDVMVKSGFLEGKPLRVGDASVVPLQFTASLLGSQKQFAYSEGERDITFIRVDVLGKRKGNERRIIYQMIDKRDLETGLTSMQRTVGFSLSLGARLILEGKLKKPGLLTPLDVPFEMVIPALEKHGIHVVRREIPLRS